jgi:hypothetical protein
VDIQALVGTFCVKAKYLARLCKTAVSGPQIEILRMLMFQRLAELKSDMRWFDFLRFMRLSIVLDEKKAEGYKRNTREWLKDILAAFAQQSSTVVNELCRLLQFVIPADGIRQIADSYPRLAPALFRTFQEADYFTEVPSLILDVVRHADQYPNGDVTRLLDDITLSFFLRLCWQMVLFAF